MRVFNNSVIYVDNSFTSTEYLSLKSTGVAAAPIGSRL